MLWITPARLTAAALLLGGPAAAQRTTYDNFNSWYMFGAEVGVSEHWTASLDTQERRSGPVDQTQSRFVRILGTYTANAATRVGFGVVRSESYPYGEIPSAYQAPEWRTFEQIQLSNAIGAVTVLHRYRLEQRWQGRRGADTSIHDITNWLRTNRFRYLLKGIRPLGGVYATASNELLVSFGKNVGQNIFDSDRLAAAIGRNLSDSWRAEVGFLEQVALKSNGRDVERNHTITFGAYFSRPYGHK